MLRVPVNRDYIRSNNRAAHNIKAHQLEQHFATNLFGGTFHDTVFNNQPQILNFERLLIHEERNLGNVFWFISRIQEISDQPV